MKIILEEIVEISPKLLLWNKMPDFINEKKIIDFLKNDVLILEYSTIEEIKSINAYIIACILNLDQLFKKDKEDKNMINQAQTLLKEVDTLENINTIVITAKHFPKIKHLFVEAGVDYFEMEKQKENILELLEDISYPNRQNKNSRTKLRLHFKPGYYKVLVKTQEYSFNGYINDLSFSGMGIILDKPEDFEKCEIGSFLNIRIDFRVSFLNIIKGMIVRKDKTKNLLGIQMDVQDKYMVDDDNAVFVKSIIDTWVAKIVQSKLISLENRDLFY